MAKHLSNITLMKLSSIGTGRSNDRRQVVVRVRHHLLRLRLHHQRIDRVDGRGVRQELLQGRGLEHRLVRRHHKHAFEYLLQSTGHNSGQLLEKTVPLLRPS